MSARLPTGMPRLDAILCGGFLPGVAVVAGDDCERFAYQLQTAVAAQEGQRHCADWFVRTYYHGQDGLIVRAVRDAREQHAVMFILWPSGRATLPAIANMIDTVLHLDGTTLHVTKNRGGSLGTVALREDGGALVEADVVPPPLTLDDIQEACDAADRVMAVLTPEQRASLYTPMLHPVIAPLTNAAFREGEAHAWAEALRIVEAHRAEWSPESDTRAIFTELLDALATAAKGRAT